MFFMFLTLSFLGRKRHFVPCLFFISPRNSRRNTTLLSMLCVARGVLRGLWWGALVGRSERRERRTAERRRTCPNRECPTSICYSTDYSNQPSSHGLTTLLFVPVKKRFHMLKAEKK